MCATLVLLDCPCRIAANAGQASGYGFELTFRLKRDPDDSSPPAWPAALMQVSATIMYT